jgi:hypothetical protein
VAREPVIDGGLPQYDVVELDCYCQALTSFAELQVQRPRPSGALTFAAAFEGRNLL